MKRKANLVTRLSEVFSRVALWSFDHKWLVLAVCLSVLAASIWLAGSLRIDNSFEAYFDHDDPVYSAYLRYRQDFGSDEVSFLLYEAPDKEHGPFDLKVMQTVDKLARTIEKEVPFVYEVSGLNNIELLEGNEDGLLVSSWVDDLQKDQKTLLEFREKILQKPLYVDGYVSSNGHYGTLLVDMDRSSIDPIEEIRLDPDAPDPDAMDNLYPQVTFHALEEILKRPEYSGIRFWHSGDVALNGTMNTIILKEGEELGAISMAIIAILLLLLFQFRILGVIGPLLVVTCSVMLSIGLMVLLGWPWDMMSSMMPTMIIAIGVAASVHILSEFWLYLDKTGDRKEAVRQTLYLVGPPCLLTSLTTAAGFMAMSISPIKTLSHMAWYSSLGVLASFVFTVTLLMFFLSFGKVKKQKKRPEIFRRFSKFSTRALASVAAFNISYSRMILLAFGLVFVFSMVGIARLEVNSNFIEEFSDRVELKHTTQFIDDVMGGTGGIVYLFDTGRPDGIKNPEVLREIERLQKEADNQTYLVKKTYSIVDLVKDINQSFHAGDPAYHTIPESRELIAQLLLVYELSGGDELSEYVSTDYSRANLEVRCRNTETKLFEALRDNLDEYMQKNPITRSEVTMTGIGRLWIKLIEHITDSQIKGLSLAFVIITAMMCFIFRSAKVGLIAMVPNISPVFLTLGMMGWLGINLDYTKLLIATVAIGIAVDDTIHMVTRFNHEYQRTGNYELALYNTFDSVGRALVITTLVLVCGFGVFMFSVMTSMILFGVLLAFTIATALIADFLLMPALILTFRPFGKEWNTEIMQAVNSQMIYQVEQDDAPRE